LFRYGLIAPLVLEVLPRGELTRRAEDIAARNYEIPYSERTSLSVDTLLDWALRYHREGFPALAPIERLKLENPHRTGMTLRRELALVSNTGSPAVSAATLYRFLKQRGLTTRQLLAAPALYPLVRGRAVCEPSEVVRLKTDGKTLDDDLG
jgi:hypothetical protein